MEAIFDALSAEEYALLKDAIPNITLLIAGADGKISESETEWAKKVTNIRSYSAAEGYQGFYTAVGESFQTRLDELLASLPQDTAARSQILSANLEKLNPILHKLHPEHAAHLYGELLSFANHVARAAGGFLKFWSIGPEEKKWIGLPMLEKFEWESEEEGTEDEED